MERKPIDITEQAYVEWMTKAHELQGITISDDIKDGFENEFYELIQMGMASGLQITKKTYESLSVGQKYHFNRKWNYKGEKVQ